MPSSIKNSVYIFIFCLAFSCCQNNDEILSPAAIVNKDSLTTAPTFTILQYGELPPPLYFNAVDITGKQYNINFVDVAGCIVSERLTDSVKQYNAKTYLALEKIYKHDVKQEISDAISIQYNYLNKLDSTLRKAGAIKNQKGLENELIYYSSHKKAYTANFIVAQPDYKVVTFKLKLVVLIDSSTKRILKITTKDTLIHQFSDLQL